MLFIHAFTALYWVLQLLRWLLNLGWFKGNFENPTQPNAVKACEKANLQWSLKFRGFLIKWKNKVFKIFFENIFLFSFLKRAVVKVIRLRRRSLSEWSEIRRRGCLRGSTKRIGSGKSALASAASRCTGSEKQTYFWWMCKYTARCKFYKILNTVKFWKTNFSLRQYFGKLWMKKITSFVFKSLFHIMRSSKLNHATIGDSVNMCRH